MDKNDGTDHDAILNNNATLQDGETPYTDNREFECCEDEVLFAMRDKHHEFSIGLSTIIQCLKISEKEGYVPKLPYHWWLSLEGRYEVLADMD